MPSVPAHTLYRQIALASGSSPLWVTCGRRRGKELSEVAAALVGCGHVSGLFVRRIWPLARMLCADRVPMVPILW